MINILKLNEITNQKHQFIDDYINISKQIIFILRNKKYESLDILIEKKQKLNESISILDDSFLKHFNQFKQELKIDDLSEFNAKGDKKVELLKQSIGDIAKKLVLIKKIDNNILELINNNFDFIKTNSKTNYALKRALEMYGTPKEL